MSKVRIGFIGCGRHSTMNIYPSLRFAPIDLVAVCDLDETKAIRNAKWFGAERVHTDYINMIEKEDLDAIFAVGDYRLYPEFAVEAMNRGLHVFIEKPPAYSLKEVKKMCEVSAQTGKHLMVGFMKRFATSSQMAKRIITSKEFGQPTMIEAKYTSSPSFEDEYRYILDNAIHYIDLLRFFMGEVSQLCAQRVQVDEKKVAYAISLQFTSGAVGTLNLSSLQSWDHPNERIEITGNDEWLVIDNVVKLTYYRKQKELFQTIQKRQLDPDHGPLVWEPNFTVPFDYNTSYYLQGFAGEIIHFAKCIQEGVEPDSNIHSAYETMECVEKIYKEHGRLLKL